MAASELPPVTRQRPQFKTSAAREIESWANLAEYMKLSQNVGRQIGQHADNVTEDRLLLTKIMDLSKERFKVMSQNNYDRKVFLERQQRKAKFMTGLLRGIDVTTYLRSIGLGTAGMSESEHIQKQYEAKMVLIREIIEARRQEKRRQRIESMSAEQVDEEEEEDEDTDDETNEARRILGECIDQLRFPDITQKPGGLSVNNIVQFLVNEADDTPVTTTQTVTVEEYESPLVKSRTKLLKMRPLNDPRYRKLERSLCDVHLPRNGEHRPVVHIVSKIDTLHRPHRRKELTFHTVNGKKLNPRVRAYMEERGLLYRAHTAFR